MSDALSLYLMLGGVAVGTIAVPLAIGLGGGYVTSHYLVKTPSYAAFAAGTVGTAILAVVAVPTIYQTVFAPTPPPPQPHIEASKTGY